MPPSTPFVGAPLLPFMLADMYTADVTVMYTVRDAGCALLALGWTLRGLPLKEERNPGILQKVEKRG